jgi:uncharacterized low-complexity protein
MKKLTLVGMLLVSALFTGMGAISLSASDAKCGAGKCGDAVKQPVKSSAKCGHDKKDDAKKCGDAKCGDEKKAPAPKCGTGKCGSK